MALTSETASRESGLGASLRQFMRMVKFEHTIFGLPFVFMGGVLAAKGLPSAYALFWMIVAATGARNFAMSLNRFADRHFDPKNPRTRDRVEFQGLLGSMKIWALMFAFAGVFVLSSWMLNLLAFYLSFVVVGVIIIYSYSKRFTSFSHLFLGFVLGTAPAGAWVAVRGELGWVPIHLFAGGMLWVAGFDVIYSCLDVDFDKSRGLYSFPRLLGVRGALVASAAAHAGTVLLLFLVGRGADLGTLYWLGLVTASTLLVWEHWVVRPDDLSRVDLSFFNINAWVSVVISAGAIADVFLASQ